MSPDRKTTDSSEATKASDDTKEDIEICIASNLPRLSKESPHPLRRNVLEILREFFSSILHHLKIRNNSTAGWTPKKLKRGEKYDVDSVTVLQGVEDLTPEDVVVAVMGPTGTGKSTFIQRATKREDWGVGHSLQSWTSEVNAVRVQFTDGVCLVLVDTPGFDDTNKSDREILETIANWFKEVYRRKLEISGILYLHRISDNRMAGTPRKNLQLFRKLYGDEFYERVILTTTMWAEKPEDDPEEPVYQERQVQLEGEYWADMINRGARPKQFRGTQESAWDILDSLIATATDRQRDRIVLEIQQELVDLAKPIPATKAGQQLHTLAEELVQRQTELLDRIKDELKKTSDPEVLRELVAELQKLRQQRQKTLGDMRQLEVSLIGKLRHLVKYLEKKTKKTGWSGANRR